MRRRRYLETSAALVTAGLAGCTSLASPSADEQNPPDDAARRISLTDVGTTPAEVDAEFDVAVGNPWVTPDGTAALEATVRNGGPETQRFQPAFYKGPSDRYGDPGIVLYSTQAPDGPAEGDAPACLNGDDHDDGDDRDYLTFTTEMQLGPALEPGESHTETLLVADDPTVEGCVPAGEYRFGRTVQLEEIPDGTRIEFDEVEERDDVALWTFTLLVEDLTGE